jgi:hypothetical protein
VRWTLLGTPGTQGGKADAMMPPGCSAQHGTWHVPWLLKYRVTCQAPVAHACNPGYSGGRDQEDRGSKPVWAQSPFRVGCPCAKSGFPQALSVPMSAPMSLPGFWWRRSAQAIA